VKRATIFTMIATALAAGLSATTTAQTHIPAKPVPTFKVVIPSVGEGSFRVMRNGQKVETVRDGFEVKPGDVVENSSATPLVLQIRAAGGAPAGTIRLVDTTRLALDETMPDGRNFAVTVTLQSGVMDAQVKTERYGFRVQSAGCTITAVGTHFMVERSSAEESAATWTSVFRGSVMVTRPGPYRRYFPVEYLVGAGDSLRFENTTFKTPRGFYEKITKSSKAVHRLAGLMSDHGH